MAKRQKVTVAYGRGFAVLINRNCMTDNLSASRSEMDLEEGLRLSPVSKSIDGHSRHKSAHMVEYRRADSLAKIDGSGVTRVGFVKGASSDVRSYPSGRVPPARRFRRPAYAGKTV